MDGEQPRTIVASNRKLRRYYYTDRQVRRIESRLVTLQQRNAAWSWARVLTFVIGLAIVVGSLFQFGQLLFWILLGLFILIFGVIVMVHRRLEKSLLRHERWVSLKKMQLARMRLDWSQLPNPRARPNFNHPYQGDLDLVGERSIACLIDLSFTESGGERLRSWLSGPVPPCDEIERRQQLVRELRSKHLLRMQLFVNAEQFDVGDEDASSTGWNSMQLEAWVKRLSTPSGWNYWLWIGWALAALNIVLLGVEFLPWLINLPNGPRLWPYSWAIYGLFILISSALGASSSDRRDVFEDAVRLRKPFEQLVALFRRLESYAYRDMPEFKSLCAPFLDEAHRPSHYLRRLVRIINATGLRGNPLVWFALNALVPWDIHFTHALDRCKEEIAHYLPIWLDVWSEVETVNSLANLGYLNPDYVFPTVTEHYEDNRNATSEMTDTIKDGGPTAAIHKPLFDAVALAHPLLPDLGLGTSNDAEHAGDDWAKGLAPINKVSNDFVLNDLGEVRLLTGSNMAGKSTFLRTLGVNMALAYAGAPVNASALALERFRIFSSIKVTDSVTDGISYFYAEVKRLRLLLDALEEADKLPVFFFIDEIYRGTNNRERLIGSRAYIKALAGMNGVGLISTHDLDLVTLADETPQIKNYHFRDEVRDDRMYFDYKLRPGPCPTTNALKIMAMEGLPAGLEEANS